MPILIPVPLLTLVCHLTMLSTVRAFPTSLYLLLTTAYEREYDCSAPRFLMGVMMLEEFRVQFSPLIPLLILELGRTYATLV